MTSQSQEQINYTFKMLYIIAIFMVIDGHIGRIDYLNLHGFFSYQNFHISLFTFASGYFLNLKYSHIDFIKRKFLHLIIPLYAWNLIYGLISHYLNTYQGFSLGSPLNLYNLFYAPLVDGHQFIYNMASWFLFPLFFIQIICFTLLKPLDNANTSTTKIASLAFFILSTTIACIILPIAQENHGSKNISLLFYRIIYFLPSFSLGFLYKHFLEKHDKLPSCIYFTIILTLQTTLNYFYPNTLHTPSWLDYFNAPAEAIYATSLLSILFWLRVSKILSPIITNNTPLLYIANNTFTIMMHHFIGFMFVKYLFSNTQNFSTYSFKNNIWYYHFPISENITTWIYITITLVITLLIGFTTKKIYGIITNINGGNYYEK